MLGLGTPCERALRYIESHDIWLERVILEYCEQVILLAFGEIKYLLHAHNWLKRGLKELHIILLIQVEMKKHAMIFYNKKGWSST